MNTKTHKNKAASIKAGDRVTILRCVTVGDTDYIVWPGSVAEVLAATAHQVQLTLNGFNFVIGTDHVSKVAVKA